jgi:hypothetical protein
MLKGPLTMIAGFAVAYAFLVPVSLYGQATQRNALPSHQMQTLK